MTPAWSEEVVVDGAVAYRVAREGDEFLAEWPGILSMRMRCDEDAPRIATSRGVEPAFIEKVRRGFLAGLVFHLRGGLAIHASSIAINGGAIALVGDSRAGKSTTAAALALAATTTVLADDATLVEWQHDRPIVRATESTSWLREDAARAFGLSPEGDKTAHRVGDEIDALSSTGAHAPRAFDLRALIILVFDDEAPQAGCLRPLEGLLQIRALLPAIIRWDRQDPERGRAEVDALAKLSGSVRMFEWTRPRDLTLLPLQIEAMLPQLRGVSLPHSNLR